MKVTITKLQLEAMDVLLSMMLRVYKPNDMAEKLLHALVHQVWEKISIKRTKSVSDHKIIHSIKLSDTEAMGLHLWYHQLITEDFLSSYRYEGIVCQSVVDQIDKEFA